MQELALGGAAAAFGVRPLRADESTEVLSGNEFDLSIGAVDVDFGGGRRTATVTTISPVRVLVLFGDDFRDLQATFPGIAAEIEAAMQQRLEPS